MAGPSFVQVHAEKVHREHPRFGSHFHRHGHKHNRDINIGGVIEVFETVSVIQFVDPNGQTVTIATFYPTDFSTSALLLPTVATPTGIFPILTTSAAIPAPALPSGNVPTTLASSVFPVIPQPTGGTQIPPGTNNTQPSAPAVSDSKISLTNPAFSFSVYTSAGSTITVSYIVTFDSTGSTLITSAITPLASSPLSGAAGGGIGATSTNNGMGMPSTTANAGGQNGTFNAEGTTSTSVVVGSVVGSVAGLALILTFLLLIIRWKRHKQPGLALGLRSGDVGGPTGAGEDHSGTGPISRQSLSFAIPAALATLTGRNRNKRVSDGATMTASSTPGSERGFYRVSGRKIQSVLESGGDGYGGGPSGSHNMDTLGEPALKRHSAGLYTGSGPSPPPISADRTQNEGVMPVMSSSPEGTTAISQRPITPTLLPPPPLVSFPWSDGVGRSLHSNDGSHASRFTEEV